MDKIRCKRCQKVQMHQNSMFYQRQCDSYFCFACLHIYTTKKQFRVLSCGHEVPSQELIAFMKRFCFMCSKQFNKQIDYQLLDNMTVCQKCFKNVKQGLQDVLIRCNCCDEIIRNSSKLSKMNQFVTICRNCQDAYENLAQGQKRLQKQKNAFIQQTRGREKQQKIKNTQQKQWKQQAYFIFKKGFESLQQNSLVNQACGKFKNYQNIQWKQQNFDLLNKGFQFLRQNALVKQIFGQKKQLNIQKQGWTQQAYDFLKKGFQSLQQKCKNGSHKRDIQYRFPLESFNVGPIPFGSEEAILTKGQMELREPCRSPNKDPFRSIGVMHVSFSNLKGYGTIFFIRENVLLTAAHNIYNRESKQSAKNIRIEMEIHQESKTYEAECAYFPIQYKNSDNKQARQYDYAIVILEDINNQYKYKPIRLSPEMELDDQVQIYGYPDDLSKKKYHQDNLMFEKGERNTTAKEKTMYGCRNKIIKLEQRVIIHNVDTSSGQSGSPVLKFNQSQGDYRAIGIHTNGLSFQNSAVRINSEVSTRIKQWIQSYKQNKYNQQRVMLVKQDSSSIVCTSIIKQNEKQIKIISITPDTKTYAWKHNFYKKYYSLRGVNCRLDRFPFPFINQPDWLCSSDLPMDGQFVFAINAKGVQRQKLFGKKIINDYYIFGKFFSGIAIGVMESRMKGSENFLSRNHCVYLFPYKKQIGRPNESQTGCQKIKCQCQTYLSQQNEYPRMIGCYVNRQQNTIMWYYNQKQQAKSHLPKSWKDKRKICAVIWLGWIHYNVQFL